MFYSDRLGAILVHPVAARVALLGSVAVVGLWAVVIAHFGATPAEDAFILFRYADHLAHGQGIVWNIGGLPVEGATDFLWLLLVAAGTRISGSPVVAAYTLSLLSILATIVLMHVFLRRVLELQSLVLRIVILCYLASPIFIHLVNGFSPPFFTMLIVLAIVSHIVVAGPPGHPRFLWGWSFVLLLVGLTRPEANALNAFLIAAHFWSTRHDRRVIWASSARALLLGYIVPGALYFAWRLWYFGLPFPLAFYVKGPPSTSPVENLFCNSQALARHLVPTAICFALAFALPGAPRRLGGLLRSTGISVLLFFGIYMFLELSQNAVYRFQYPFFVVFLLLSAVKVAYAMRKSAFLGACGISMLCVGTGLFTVTAVPIPEARDETIALGKRLRPFSDRGYALATTEAGRLPYSSGWRTLDVCGLNDPGVAQGRFTYEYWRSFAPAIVLIHPSAFWPLDRDPREVDPRNPRSRVLEFMIQDGSYELVAAFRRRSRRGGYRAEDVDLYFASTSCPDYAGVRATLLGFPGARYADVPRAITTLLAGTPRKGKVLE